MTDKAKEVESMISKVMKKRGLTRNQAIDYMLGVATGRLAALWRYDATVPEGKVNKGVMIAGKKKRAEKTAKITILPDVDTSARSAKSRAKAAKAAKAPKAAKKKPKPKKAKAEAAEIATAAE